MPKAVDQNIIELSNALTRGDVAGALKALGLPPGVGGETPDAWRSIDAPKPASHWAAQDGASIASLMRVRGWHRPVQALMDATDGDPDFEDEPTDSNLAGSQCCIDDCEKTG